MILKLDTAVKLPKIEVTKRVTWECPSCDETCTETEPIRAGVVLKCDNTDCDYAFRVPAKSSKK